MLDEEIMDYLKDDIIRVCFVDGDEDSSRENFRRAVSFFKGKQKVIKDEIFDKALHALDNLTYEELRVNYIYHEGDEYHYLGLDLICGFRAYVRVEGNRSDELDIRPKGQLFVELFYGKQYATNVLADHIGNEVICSSVDPFIFDGDYYVALVKQGEETKKYYEYRCELIDEERFERIVRVRDESRISIFRFLGH